MSWKQRLKKQLGWEVLEETSNQIVVRSPSAATYLIYKRAYAPYVPYMFVNKTTAIASNTMVPGPWTWIKNQRWIPIMVSALHELETTPKQWQPISETYSFSPEASENYGLMLARNIDIHLSKNNLPAARSVLVSDLAYSLNAEDMLGLLANSYYAKEELSIYRQHYAQAVMYAMIAGGWSEEETKNAINRLI